jgi:hypothetical protein
VVSPIHSPPDLQRWQNEISNAFNTEKMTSNFITIPSTNDLDSYAAKVLQNMYLTKDLPATELGMFCAFELQAKGFLTITENSVVNVRLTEKGKKALELYIEQKTSN